MESWIPLAVTHLRADPLLGPHLDRLPPPELAPQPDLFRWLVQAILSQQLSTRSAAAITTRFVALFPDAEFPSPADVASAEIDALRAAGLSRPKIAYLRDLGARCASGEIDLARLPDLSDEDLAAHLTAVKGIGPWTVDMLKIFALHRPDILPLGDLGIRRGILHLAQREAMTPDEMTALATPWRPYRSAASWYLWRLTG